jgi:hypothetical protein
MCWLGILQASLLTQQCPSEWIETLRARDDKKDADIQGRDETLHFTATMCASLSHPRPRPFH